MASNENDSAKTTKEQASQTYTSPEGRSTTDKAQDGSENSDFGPLANLHVSEPITDRSGSDQTAVKTISETARSGFSTYEDGQMGSQEDRVVEERQKSYLHDHQSEHAQSLVGEEHTLHQAKQEDLRRGRTPIQSESSVEEELDYLRGASHTMYYLPGRGDDSIISSSLSSSQSSIPTCDTCSAADELLSCSASKEFWKGVETTRSKCCERLWTNFHRKLKETFPEEESLKQRRVVNMMKALLEINDPSDNVKISKYIRLVKYMGPFKAEKDRCIVLKQLEDLVSKSHSLDPKNKRKKLCWFAGPMTRDVAEIKLNGKPPGTFLVRMSASEEEKGSFALNLMMTDSTFENFLLEGHHEEAASSNPFSLCLTFRGIKYSSLPELVNGFLRKEEIAAKDCDNATRCSLICPDLPFNQIINGYSK